MADTDLSLMAHLLRRAGFGARRDELEAYAAKGYEATVDDLVNPARFPEADLRLVSRYYGSGSRGYSPGWLYRINNTQRPLQEKMVIFWHGIFATSQMKSGHAKSGGDQIGMFRQNCLSDMRTILMDLSTDPAMLFWLDNNENVRETPNENYGREILELFSMGVGNYTEYDVKAASKAFSGWSLETPMPASRGGHAGGFPTRFVYRDEEHDDSEKSFLGHSGRLNGEDVIDIVARQPATARFIAKHLYTYFVADEPPVASWNELPPQDAAAIETLVAAYMDSGGELRSILRVLFNSDFFKEARYKRVKSPTELTMGLMKLIGAHTTVEPGIGMYSNAAGKMGQRLMGPMTVEGWHTGKEWIDGGTLNERINFAATMVGDATQPGIQFVVDRLSREGPLSPEELVDRSLDLVGPINVDDEARDGLLTYAHSGGDLNFETAPEESAKRVVRMLQLIVSTREYQFA